MDEKKVAAGLPGETGGPFSGVGVSGAGVMVESLLGPRVPEPALLLRWEIMVPGDDASGLDRVLAVATRSGWLGSVGVGGVLTMTGVTVSADGGVWGGAFKGSIF